MTDGQTDRRRTDTTTAYSARASIASRAKMRSKSHGYEKVTVTRLPVKYAAATGVGLHVNRTARVSS